MTVERPWTRPDSVTILGAESQEVAFVSQELVERLAPASSLLAAEGGQRWLSASEISDLRTELTGVAEQAGPGEDLRGVIQAIELIDYEVANGTGVAVVPPAE